MSGLPSWARVGAKVVCVDGKPRLCSTAPLPHEGAIYTIRGVEWCVWGSGDVGPAVYLVEINRGKSAGREWPFGLNRFRPMVTQEDDIATHFRQHLDVREPEGV